MNDLVQLTARFTYPDGTPVKARVHAKLTHPDVDSQGYHAVKDLFFDTDDRGVALLDLWPNARGSTSSRYKIVATDKSHGAKILDVLATIPDMDCYLADIADLPPYPGKKEGVLAVESAQAAAACATHERDQVQHIARSIPIAEIKQIPTLLRTNQAVLAEVKGIAYTAEKVNAYQQAAQQSVRQSAVSAKTAQVAVVASGDAVAAAQSHADKAHDMFEQIRNGALMPLMGMATAMIETQAFVLGTDTGCSGCQEGC